MANLTPCVLAIGFLSSVAIANTVTKNLPCDPTLGIEQICSIKITKVEEYKPNTSASTLENGPVSALPTIPVTDIINIGKQIWDIIVANKPVVNTEYNFANALPKGVESTQDLSNWQAPVHTTYTIAYSNWMGVEVVNYKYMITAVYGGSYNGTGKYLGDVRIVPLNLIVKWGYTFEASAKAGSIFNMGTAENPIAGLSMLHNWKIITNTKDQEKTDYFMIRGDGDIQLID